MSVVLIQTGVAEIAVKSGEKVGFLGDSLTEFGWKYPAGYVRLVVAGLEANGVHAEVVPAGVSGHKSDQMLARLEKDVLSKNVQWMTLSCGVNDVWHGKGGVPFDDVDAARGTYDQKVAMRGTYRSNMTQMVEKAQAAGVKVVLLTAPVIKEDLGNALNAKLSPYNDFLRQLAKEKNLPLADLNAMFHERIKAEGKPKQNLLTVDGVHMNLAGDMLMAKGVLQAFGLDAAQLKKAEESWAPLVAKAEEAAKAAADAKAAAALAKKAVAEKAAAEKAAAQTAPAPAFK